jgi:hypothetical protein
MKTLGKFTLVCAVFLFASAASADTYVVFNCDWLNCDETYKLKKSQTKEFRGKCGGTQPKKLQCKPKSGSVSCTVTVAWGTYKSCSCTNWDPLSKHKAEIKIECYGG